MASLLILLLDSPLVKAAVLDPCYKQLKFLKSEQTKIVHQKNIELLDSESQSMVSVKTAPGEPEDSSLASPEKSNSCLIAYLGIYVTSQHQPELKKSSKIIFLNQLELQTL